MTRLEPLSARRSAMARPTPELAPTTTALDTDALPELGLASAVGVEATEPGAESIIVRKDQPAGLRLEAAVLRDIHACLVRDGQSVELGEQLQGPRACGCV